MRPSDPVHLDPLLGEAGADVLMRLAEHCGTYRSLAEEPIFDGLGDGLSEPRPEED